LSSKSNINTDHYKMAGRGRQGEGLVPEAHKHVLAKAKRRTHQSEESFFPGALDESARAKGTGRLERLKRSRRLRKPRGLTAKQLMERRMRLTQAASTS
jgi:hypothetical protein